MYTNISSNQRPYWHVDAKWITGVLLLFLLNATFLVFLVWRITAPEPGIEILTIVIASSFSREGLDQAADIETMHQRIAESPDGSWQPIPGMNIVVREEDIAGLSPREARLWFFRHLAEPIYFRGQQGLADLATDPEVKKNTEGGIGPLGFISAETHNKLNRALLVLGAISLVLLGLLIYFSYRFGRLGSPGCVIFLSAVPGLIVFSGMRGWLENAGQNPVTEETTLTLYTQMITRLAVDVLPNIVQKAIQTYLFLTILGLSLILVALICTLIFREKTNRRR